MGQHLKFIKQTPSLANRQEKSKVINEKNNARKNVENAKTQTFL